MGSEIFNDRQEAGIFLAKKLDQYKNTNAIVLAVPRGGVPVAFPVSQELNIPLDIVLSKKIGHPQYSEYAIGSVSPDSVVLDEHPEVPEEYIRQEISKIREILKLRYRLYRKNLPQLDFKGKKIIVVDDGIATGNTLLATLKMLRKKQPEKIIVATPVSSVFAKEKVSHVADEFICLNVPENFRNVGAYYHNFEQLNDEQVIALLSEANQRHRK